VGGVHGDRHRVRALLGSRVPAGLKVFLLSLAIIDDILGVLVIAVFFSSAINGAWLAVAVAGFALMTALNRLGVRRLSVYVVIGAGVWLCTLESGVHPTVAGAVLGLAAPARAWLGSETRREMLERAAGRLRRADPGSGPDPERRRAAEDLALVATESVSPLERLEHGLHAWVSFGIMPVFALANAGVAVSLDGMAHPIAAAVIVALVTGKPIGIVSASWLAVRAGVARMPESTSWMALIGAGCLGGIGFTMALFIASLSLTGADLDAAKSGVLAGSAVSLCLGLGVLAWFLPKARR
jgi:NhaA family Na+:H+ antiporter